jgi:hypothetical protein
MPRTETALGAALAKAGLAQHQMKAFTTATDFINAGGTLDEWIQVYNLVAFRIVDRNMERAKRKGAAPHQPELQPEPQPEPEKEAREKARRKARDVRRRTVWECYLTHSGRLWAKVRYNELGDMADDGNLSIMLLQHIGPLKGDDRQKQISDLVKPNEFVQLAQKAGIKPS